ncbi:MAG: hypothetical protein ACRCWS_02875, partial [Propionibacteriaceae bacterium]
MRILRNSAKTIGAEFRAAPIAMSAMVAMMALLGALPSLQIVGMRHLANVASSGATTGKVLWATVILALLVGLGLTVEVVRGALGSMLMEKMRGVYSRRVLDVMAQMQPRELADPAVADEARTVCDAASTHVAGMAHWVMRIVTSVLGIVGIFLALIPVSLAAAVLIMGALAPLIISSLFASKNADRYWPMIGKEQRRFNYLATQLTDQRTSTELVSLGTSGKISDLAGERQTACYSLKRAMQTRDATYSVTSGLVTSVLLGLALWSIVMCHGGSSSGIAAGVMAVISGLGITSQAGHNIGDVIVSSQMATRYFAFVEQQHMPRGTANIARVNELVVDNISYRYPG